MKINEERDAIKVEDEISIHSRIKHAIIYQAEMKQIVANLKKYFKIKSQWY
ncbi:hypothetical protein ACNQ21_02920 [Mycoplasma sp. VS299A]|uniref:hypothetical protein n=1 Tax=Mycoplasma sp. VS299A TaxID=3401690 RepID=UPI003AAC58A4